MVAFHLGQLQPKPPALRPLVVLLGTLVTALGVVLFFIFTHIIVDPVPSYDKCMALAARYLEALDYEQAEALYLEAIELDGTRSEAYLELAGMYLEQGRTEDALQGLMQGLEATADAQLQAALDELLPNLSYDQCMALAIFYQTMEDYDRSEEALLAAISLQNRRAEAYQALAELYLAQQRPGDALHILMQGVDATGVTELQTLLLELLPHLSYDECLTLAAYHLEDSNDAWAEEAYLTALDLDSSRIEAYQELAQMYIRLDRTEDAITILERGIEATGSEELQLMLEDLRPPEEEIGVTAYADVVLQYEAQYGAPVDRYDYLTGESILLLELIDFDGDGTLELLVGYSRIAAEIYGDPIRYPFLDLWYLDNAGQPVLGYEGATVTGSDVLYGMCGYTFENDKYYLLDGYDSAYTISLDYISMEDGSCITAFHIEADGEDYRANYPALNENTSTIDQDVCAASDEYWSHVCAVRDSILSGGALVEPFDWNSY